MLSALSTMRRSLARAAAPCAAALLGCTTLQPVPPLGSDFRLREKAAAGAPERCESGQADESQCVAPAVPLDGYYGELPFRIWTVDLERRRWTRLGAEKTNQAGLYNAMLWPVGAFLGARALADPGTSLIRDVGAFSIAAVGLLGSGIPDRDKLYLEAARRHACAVALAGRYLYAKADIGTLDAWPYTSLRTLPADAPTLAAAQSELRSAIDAFDEQGVQVRARLKRKPPPAIDPQTPVERRHREATGQGTGGPAAGDDNVQAFADSLDIRLRDARAAQGRLDAVTRDIDDAATELQERQVDTSRRLSLALAERAPALTQPGDALTQVVTALGKLTAALPPAQGASTASASASAPASASGKAQGGTKPWAVDERVLASLQVDSRGQLVAFEAGPALRLRRAVDRAKSWREAFDARVKQGAQRAAAIGCSSSLFGGAEALALQPAAPAPAASATN